MLFAIVLASAALGAVWVYVVPMIQNALTGVIPASFTGNKIFQVVSAGVMILVAVWITSLIAKGFVRKAL